MSKRFLTYTFLATILSSSIVTMPSFADTYVTVPKAVGFNWFNRMGEGVTKFAKDTGIKAYMQGPSKFDSAMQVQVLEDIISQKPDVLAVVPFQPETVEVQLANAQKNGIIVVTHEAPNIKNASYDIEPFVNADYGRHLMQSLAKLMNENGEYVMFVGSLSSETHKAWVNAALDYQKTHYPNMKLVGGFNESHDDVKIAKDKMNELLKKYPHIKGVQGSSALDVVGAGQAIEDAGLEGKIAVVGTSIVSYAKDQLESGAISMISGWDPAVSGYAMNKVAQLIKEKKPITDGMDLGLPGYEHIKIIGKVIYGSAWIDVTTKNMGEYNY